MVKAENIETPFKHSSFIIKFVIYKWDSKGVDPWTKSNTFEIFCWTSRCVIFVFVFVNKMIIKVYLLMTCRIIVGCIPAIGILLWTMPNLTNLSPTKTLSVMDTNANKTWRIVFFFVWNGFKRRAPCTNGYNEYTSVLGTLSHTKGG